MNLLQEGRPSGARVRAVMGMMCVGVLAGSALAHDMIEVGVTTDKSKLVGHFDITFPIQMPQSIFDTVPGFAFAELGYEALLFDDLEESVLKLPDNCDIRVRVIGSDPHVFLWNDHTTAQLNVGEAFNIGVPYFHTHPIWQIDEAGFGKDYHIVLQLEDTTGNYQTSDPFTITFTPVPAPGAAGLLGFAGVMGLRRKRVG